MASVVRVATEGQPQAAPMFCCANNELLNMVIPNMENRPISSFLLFILNIILVSVKLDYKKKLAMKPTLSV
jgi:hypothetical protein